MKKIHTLILTSLLCFCVKTTFSQSVDSLSIFPNPFSVSTTIRFNIAQSDTISLRVFNPLGQQIRTFFDSTVLNSGSHTIIWSDDSLADGIYFVILEIGSTKRINKVAIKSGSTSGLANTNPKNKFYIFPNPTNDFISVPLDGNKTIILTDLEGKVLKSFSTDQKVISLSDMVSGQYYITVVNNKNESITTKLVLKRE